MGPSPRESALPDKATAVGKSAGLEGGEDELSPGSPAPGDEAERGGLGRARVSSAASLGSGAPLAGAGPVPGGSAPGGDAAWPGH